MDVVAAPGSTVAEHGQVLLLVLFKLIDAFGYRLPIVRAELLGSISQTSRHPTRSSRLATGLIVTTTAITIANTTIIEGVAAAAVAARNLGVGADGKQPIIATTRSDRIANADATPRPIRGGQRSIGRRPMLKPEIFAHRRSSGAGTGGT